MAKINNRTNKVKRTKDQKREDRIRSRMDPVAALVLDPCNADVSPALYNGEGGYTQRFVKTINVTTGATDTAMAFSFYPGAPMIASGTAVNSTTVIPAGYTTAGVPGITYLASNANKVRCKAACVEMWSSQPQVSVQGNLTFGVLSASQYQSGTGQSADTLGSVLTHQVKLTSDIVQCIWFPGAQDCYFNQIPVTLPSTTLPTNADDQNCITIVGTGLPVSTTYTFRVTYVVEWLPKPGLEIANVEGGGGNSERTFQIVNALHRAKPGWYATLKSHAQQFATMAGPIVQKELKGLAQNYGPHLLKSISGMVL